MCNETEQELKEFCEQILPEKLNQELQKIIKHKGIKIKNNPEIIFKPKIKIKDKKIDGGKITFEINF